MTKNPSLITSLRFFILIFNYLFWASTVNGQSAETKRNPYILTKNSFSIGLTEGFNQSKFTPIIGTITPGSPIGILHKLNFDYTFSLGDHLSVGLGTGFGFFPFTASFHAKSPFSGSDSWGILPIIDYTIFSDFRGNFNYHYWLSSKYGFHSSFGVGVLKSLPSKSSISYATQDGTAAFFSTVYSDKINPYFSFRIGLDRVLKNDDLLSLGISYQLHTTDLYTGKYRLYNNTELGTYSNNGNSFNLSLNYAFTRARKMLYAEKYTFEKEVDFKQAKKQFKSERRFIDPKSMFFGFSVGRFNSRNQVIGNKTDFISKGMSSWIGQVDAEIGWKNQLFSQFAIGVAEYVSVTRINRPDVHWYSGSNAFISPMISAGIGYRLIGINNINFLNASVGLTLSANFNQKGQNGSGGSTHSLKDGTVQYIVKEKYFTRHHLIPSLYLNLSRDFQLTKTLYLSADYRFNLGFITAYEQEVTLYEQPDLTIPHENSIAIKGTSNAFQLGLKYKFVPKK